MNWTYLWTSFDGRIGRQLFWAAFLPLFIAEIAAHLIVYRIGGERPTAIVDLAFAYPQFAVFAKRAHDRDIPTWVPGGLFALAIFMDFLLILGLSGRTEEPNAIVLVISFIWLVYAMSLIVELGFRPGTAGPNRFGPDPLARA